MQMNRCNRFLSLPDTARLLPLERAASVQPPDRRSVAVMVRIARRTGWQRGYLLSFRPVD